MPHTTPTTEQQDQQEIQDGLLIPYRPGVARCDWCYMACPNCRTPNQQKLPVLSGKIATRLQRRTV